jgi:hypothetical protein
VAGHDYVATSGTLVFGPGETTKTVTVPILHDADEPAQGYEVFQFKLTSAVGATIARSAVAGWIHES